LSCGGSPSGKMNACRRPAASESGARRLLSQPRDRRAAGEHAGGDARIVFGLLSVLNAMHSAIDRRARPMIDEDGGPTATIRGAIPGTCGSRRACVTARTTWQCTSSANRFPSRTCRCPATPCHPIAGSFASKRCTRTSVVAIYATSRGATADLKTASFRRKRTHEKAQADLRDAHHIFLKDIREISRAHSDVDFAKMKVETAALRCQGRFSGWPRRRKSTRTP
jgi:hypothetical protein